MYFDVNNHYDCYRPLPYAHFLWVDNIDNFDVTIITIDSLGYVLEIDLDYPQHLHLAQSNLPYSMREKSGKREEKFLAILYDKKHHLQQCTRHGLRITKIHHIL